MSSVVAWSMQKRESRAKDPGLQSEVVYFVFSRRNKTEGHRIYRPAKVAGILKQRHAGYMRRARAFLGGSDDKESACNARDLGLIPRLGRSPGEGNGNPLQ